MYWRRLRQAPGLAPINAKPVPPTDGSTPVADPANPAIPEVNPAAPPVVVPVAPHAFTPVLAATTTSIVHPAPVVPPAVPTPISAPPAITSMPPAPPLESGYYVSTQWVETWLDSTSRTWVPKTVTMRHGDYVTTQWVETWLDSTSRTWVPRTITLRYKPAKLAPLPGSGEIGLGTLTGETGKTKTVVMGAAPSQGPGWKRGVVAAVGVGIVGMVV